MEYMNERGPLHGRKKIFTNAKEITMDNVIDILNQALNVHNSNAMDIQYLWRYYRGAQPIESRNKEIRPEINNKIVENRANEIVSFKTGYLIGEPLQYVSRGEDVDIDAINQLNEYVFAEEKATKDKELADWFHICGTSYRLILPDEHGEEDESPFELYTLDPRRTFVVYENSLKQEPIMGVTYVKDELGNITYSIYTKDHYFEIKNDSVIDDNPHILGEIPIIEYPLNYARLGAFEVVLPLLDAMNTVESNRLDGIEQFIQAILLFHNVEIDKDQYENLRKDGAIKIKDIDERMKADVKYLTAELNQLQTQTLIDHMYQSVLTICGMPNRNGGSSTSDTGSAVIMRDGWEGADARAKDAELMFKCSERRALRVMLNICNAYNRLDLKVSEIEIRFTRRNYENILQKAQVLTTLLNNDKVHPKLAFEHSGLFVDPDLAYTISRKYEEEREQQNELRTGRDPDDLETPEEGQSGRTVNRGREDRNRGNQTKTTNEE